MYIPYRGYKVTINREKWKALPAGKKLECVRSYFCKHSAYIKRRLTVTGAAGSASMYRILETLV